MPRRPRFQVVPSAYVFLRRPDEVLLQLRAGTGYLDGHWAAGAAGHVEAGESVIVAARREAREELGIAIHPSDLLPITTMHRTTGSVDPMEQRMDVFFECWVWEGEPTLREEKAVELTWFRLDALPAPVSPYELVVLERRHAGTLLPVIAHGF